MTKENLMGRKVEILATGEKGEVVEHFPDMGELEVSLPNGGLFQTSESEVKLLDDIKIICPKCGKKFPKSQMKEVYDDE